jgi:tetratricopeptide (TPR) repeat protein
MYFCTLNFERMTENLSFDDIKQRFNNDKNFKLGTYIVGGILGLVLVFFLYRQFIWTPANEKSNDGWWSSMNLIEKDSTDQAIKTLEPFVKSYDGKTGGEIGQYLLGTQYMKKGEFKKALDVLADVKLSDTYISTMSIGLQGDCHSEMKNYDDALKMYVKAANNIENEMTTPMYLFKAGLCAEKLKKFEDATTYYTRIQDDFPGYAGQKTIEKYIARVSSIKSK